MARTFSGKRPQNLKHTLHTFFSYLGKHKILLVLVGIFAAVSASANMIRPVVNQIVENHSLTALLFNVMVTAGIYALGALSTLGYTQLMVRAAQKILFDIRRDLYNHLQKLPLRFFDSQKKEIL